MGKYFTVRVKPTMPMATQIQSGGSDLAFGNGDVLWDWHAFDIPKGAARLIDITILVQGEDAAPQTAKDVDMFFAKTSSDGSAPSSIGTGNATMGGTGYTNNIIGVSHIEAADFKAVQDYMSMASTGHGAGTNYVPSLVLEGNPDSGTNVGYDKIYIAAGTANTAWDFSTGVLINNASNYADGASTTLITDGTDAHKVFSPGDIIHVHDVETSIGTVKSVTANLITLETANVGAIANNDEVMNISPITLILSFEK